MSTTSSTWTRQLVAEGACSDAIEWAKNYDTFDSAWTACERGDWMLWWAGKQSGASGTPERRALVLVACQCARLSLKYVKEGETRPLAAIEIAERWARQETGVTLALVRSASDAAYAAAAAADAAADASDAAYAAYAAAAAADAAAAAAAAAADADAAYAAAYAAYDAAYAAYDAARSLTLRACADIVRATYPTPPARRK